MLEVSIVDAKVGKSSWINKINSHHGGGGRGGNGGGGDSPIVCGSAAEVTNDNSERADSVKSWFHNRQPFAFCRTWRISGSFPAEPSFSLLCATNLAYSSVGTIIVGIIAGSRGKVQAGFGRLDSDAGALKHSV